jgi:hypothetical protein
MTNKVKYKTPRELERAFQNYCNVNMCNTCPITYVKRMFSVSRCLVAWLELDSETGCLPTPQWQKNIMNRFTDRE